MSEMPEGFIVKIVQDSPNQAVPMAPRLNRNGDLLRLPTDSKAACSDGHFRRIYRRFMSHMHIGDFIVIKGVETFIEQDDIPQTEPART